MMANTYDLKLKRLLIIAVCFAALYWLIFSRRTFPALQKDSSLRSESRQRPRSKTHLADEKAEARIHTSEHAQLKDELEITAQKLQDVQVELAQARILLQEERSKEKRVREETVKATVAPHYPIQTRKHYVFDGHRLVHIDMKGAPPKLDYLLRLLPLLKRNGATGLLLEYEDMFPFTGQLEPLKSKDAYSKSSLTQFIQSAREDMLIIPLVQTFGHLEFVLKHKEFSHLREHPDRMDALSPGSNTSLSFVKEIIKQVTELHSPGLKLLHVGGDEVWSLRNKNNAADIYLSHMIPVLEFVRSLQLKPIIWDDMFRTWSTDHLLQISKLAEPMVWDYRPVLHIKNRTWENYKQAFTTIWIATAFKGAEKPNSVSVHIHHRIENHLAWIKLMPSLRPITVAGFALTGWSRYNHRSTLCEMLPASIPSLICCLKVIETGKFDENTTRAVSDELGFKKPLVIDSHVVFVPQANLQKGSFPGYKLYTVNQRLLKAFSMTLHLNTKLRSWVSKFLKNRSGSVDKDFIHSWIALGEKAEDIYKETKETSKTIFGDVFYDSTAIEFEVDVINPWLEETVSAIAAAKDAQSQN